MSEEQTIYQEHREAPLAGGGDAMESVLFWCRLHANGEVGAGKAIRRIEEIARRESSPSRPEDRGADAVPIQDSGNVRWGNATTPIPSAGEGEEVCGAQTTGGFEDAYATYSCEFPRGHYGWHHQEEPYCDWTDAFCIYPDSSDPWWETQEPGYVPARPSSVPHNDSKTPPNDSITAPTPPRDPAGEGEEDECSHCHGSGDEEAPFTDSLDYGPRYMPCRACGGSGAARPSSPTGETPESYCDRCNYDRHTCPGCGDGLPHGVEVCGHCKSTGETPCATCGGTELVSQSGRGSDGPDPCPDCQPTGETPTGCGYVYESGRVCNDEEYGLTHRPWAWVSENGTPHGDNPNYHEYVPPQPTRETPCATCGHDHTNAATGEREAACTDVDGLGTDDDPFKECNCGWPTGETAGQGVEEAWVRGSDWDGYVTYLNPSTGGREKVSLAVEQAIRAPLEASATAAEAERDRLREAVRHLSLRSMRFKGGEPGIGCDLCMRCWPEGDAEDHRDDCLAALAGEPTGAGEGE